MKSVAQWDKIMQDDWPSDEEADAPGEDGLMREGAFRDRLDDVVRMMKAQGEAEKERQREEAEAAEATYRARRQVVEEAVARARQEQKEAQEAASSDDDLARTIARRICEDAAR